MTTEVPLSSLSTLRFGELTFDQLEDGDLFICNASQFQPIYGQPIGADVLRKSSDLTAHTPDGDVVYVEPDDSVIKLDGNMP